MPSVNPSIAPTVSAWVAKPAGANVQAFLGNLPMFSEMSREELDRVAAFTLPSCAAKGEAVFHAGDPCTGFHIVVYGQVKLGFNSPQGGEKVIEIIGPGQSFGEALMFLEKPYIVFARALADTLLLHVAKHRVFSELAGDPAFSRKVLSGLSRRLHGLVQDVEAYSLRSSAGKSVVASRLNMTPEHSLMQIKTGTCYQVQNLIYRMDEQKQTRLKRLLQRIGAGIVQDVPPELYACEICRRTRCVQDEWIVCESRIAHAKCLEEVMDKEQS